MNTRAHYINTNRGRHTSRPNFSAMKHVKKQIAKIDIKVRREIKAIDGVIMDYKGNVWKLPYKGSDGRVWRLRLIKMFYHKDKYAAYQINGKIISEKVLLAGAVEVDYKKRFEVDLANVPTDMLHYIAAYVDAPDTRPNK